jgi:hypothetical protein
MALDPVNDGDSASSARDKINTAIQAVDVNTTALTNKQDLDAALTQISGLTFADNDSIYQVGGTLVNRTIAQAKTILAIAQSDVSGLVAALAAKQAGNAADTTIWTIVDAADADYDLAAGFNKKHIRFTTTATRLLNIPLNGTEAIDIGAEFMIANLAGSTDPVTLTPAIGVTLEVVNGVNGTMNAQTGCHLVKVALDTWVASY